MALLDTLSRARVCAQIMRPQNGLGPLGSITKADLRAAVDATDAWIEDNSSSYNTSIPQPARNQLTATQKTILFCYVAMRRAGLFRTEEE